ncbi:hypothetical protein PHYSODRAFT_306161 [Phytophthora sojae]|uniref:Uncharacterized protein n=1 Tax=Phytophthora sojae (strain P6497) TaxID=1094619 RepID=G5A853_PHYSP|nr:hypothetical protein PHYSODRAFT_306161 [Phytophthora sojae]EGZ08079.1 hypothetical protein PHYSODRAFT_306161 [Phytophthora sojae]|eukprot:XP_009536251.1 hypothetical protein PHYSODRAFT_306161 [Phytophthora sojae]
MSMSSRSCGWVIKLQNDSCLAKLTQARRTGDIEVVETLVLQLVDAELLPSLGGEQCDVAARVFKDCASGIKSTRSMALLHTREEEEEIAQQTTYDLELARVRYELAKHQASMTTQFKELLTDAVDYWGDGIFRSWDWIGSGDGMRISTRACGDDRVTEEVAIDSNMQPDPRTQSRKRRSKRKNQRSASRELH